MNIVYFLTYGYSLKTWDQSSALIREIKYFNFLSEQYGYKFFIVTYGDEEDLNYENLFLNAEIIPIYKYIKKSKFKLVNLFLSFFYSFRIKNLINENISITKQNQLLGSWVSYCFKKITKSKLFIRTGYDMYLFSIKDKKSLLKQLLYRQLTSLSLVFADIYSVSSNSDYDFLKIKFLKKRKKQEVFLLPNWVDTATSEKIKFREETIISVGRLETQKNYSFLIKEFSKISQNLIIYGKGTKKLKLINLAKKYKTNLEIIEQVDNKSLLIKLSNTKFFILGSHFEGHPKALLEAMGAGCIVLASKISNHEEIIEDGVDGYLFEIKKNSLKKLFENISSKDEEELQNISYNAIRKIQSNFSISKIANEENRLIRSLEHE